MVDIQRWWKAELSWRKLTPYCEVQIFRLFNAVLCYFKPLDYPFSSILCLETLFGASEDVTNYSILTLLLQKLSVNECLYISSIYHHVLSRSWASAFLSVSLTPLTLGTCFWCVCLVHSWQVTVSLMILYVLPVRYLLIGDRTVNAKIRIVKGHSLKTANRMHVIWDWTFSAPYVCKNTFRMKQRFMTIATELL